MRSGQSCRHSQLTRANKCFRSPDILRTGILLQGFCAGLYVRGLATA